MQSTATPKYLTVRLRFALLLCLLTGITTSVSAQQYVNGNISTGATSKNGTAAPAGYTWSELQNDNGNTTETNTSLGFGASVAGSASIADDFTVPAGQTWNITKFTTYGYSTGYTGTTSPFAELRVRIHSSSPAAGATTILFGDLTTNRMTATSDALIYRTGNTSVPTNAAPGTTRKIFKMEAAVSVSLPAGTYWIEWQNATVTGVTSNFCPPSTPVGSRTSPGANAIQNTGTWAALIDGGNPATAPDVALDMPFTLDYTLAGGTVPSCATGLAPANNATGVANTGSLSWTAVSGATSYDVYLGTNASPALVTNVTGTSYTFSPALSLGTLYYYKIVPRNAAGPATGCSVLQFTTANVSCTQPTVPTLSADTSYCGTGSATLRVTGGTLNNATEWRWYTGSCGGTLAGTGTSITVSPASTTTYYVRGEGGCVTTGSCASVTDTKVTSIGAPVINPVAPICLNTLSPLTINPFTLGTTPIPDSVTVTSGTVSIPVPDNVSDGAFSSLTIPALPVGAVVTGIDVTLSMTHTYPGDMIFNLKAPNGKILNLYKYAGGNFTGNNGGLTNAGWFNTLITSTGTRTFASVAAPYNYGAGPYAPDALNTAVTGVPVQNPTGYASTETGFSSLYTVPNGTWTLAMADGGPGDVGTLTRWTLKIRYNKFTQVPSNPAIWSPAATLFTDAAGTVPYDGTTPLFQVYAKPTVTTTYSATSVSGSCTSPAATATVTVYNPAVISVQPTNKTVCQAGTVTISTDATGTTPSYQWFVNDGSGFVAIANNGNYAGATTNTLTISNAPASFNGYQYQCVVTSAAPCLQTSTTNASTLTVNPTPTVSLSASRYNNLLPGLTTTITVASNPSGATYTWAKNNRSISNTAATLTAGVDDLGSYTATVVDINGCVNTTAALVIGDSASSRLFIYPNPNNGQFQVRYHSLNGNTLPRSMMVYDAKGALVYQQVYAVGKPYDRMDVDFRRLSKGVYMINLLASNGKRLASGKVLVQ